MDTITSIETPVAPSRRPCRRRDMADRRRGKVPRVLGELPLDQREWWRRCATYAVREWLGGVRLPL